MAAALSITAALAVAQSRPVLPGATTPPTTTGADIPGVDALADALACRVGFARFPGLMQEIRDERADDFRQAYRQYNAPMMDLYRLETPVQAWGNESDTIAIESNRVMMAVPGSLDAVTEKLEAALAKSSQSPLSGALDDQHALLIFEASQPGLEGMVLLGCEYRIADPSLLEDPEDAWRKDRAPDGAPPQASPRTEPQAPG